MDSAGQSDLCSRRCSREPLFSGKLHAAITRRYTKGRDWYDLFWYRSHRPPVEPNLDLLQNALDQTQSAGRLNARDWGGRVRDRIAAADIDTIIADVRPFLERPQDAALLTRDNLLALLPYRKE